MTNVGSTNNSSASGNSIESPTQKADDVRPPFDGPHAAGATKNNSSGSDTPAYVVAVSKHEKTDDDSSVKVARKYDPQALKARARGLLKNGNIDPEQRRVLKEILGPEETKEKAVK